MFQQLLAVAFVAVAAEHSETSDAVTIAFMNIGLTQTAFDGGNKDKHLAKIETQVRELFIRHSVSILCFVEAGQPKQGLSHDAKAAFENAVQSGASGHISGTLRFLWADDNEALLLAHLGAVSVS